MKKILIDATHAEETRVVLLDGTRVDDFESENIGKQQHKGNIYIGHVSRVEPSLQAAFITYGGNRNGFLAFGELHPQFFAIKPAEKAALLEEMAEQATRRRGEDDAETEGSLQPRHQEARPEGDHREGGRDRGHRGHHNSARSGGRVRPQRLSDSTAAPAAAEEAVAETPSIPTPEAGNTAAPAAAPYYEDAEDAAAARKAAQMAEANESGTEGNQAAKAGRPFNKHKGPKGAKGGRGGRPQRGESGSGQAGQTAESAAPRAGGQGHGGGKARPKRLNAYNYADNAEVSQVAEGLSESIAEETTSEAPTETSLEATATAPKGRQTRKPRPDRAPRNAGKNSKSAAKPEAKTEEGAAEKAEAKPVAIAAEKSEKTETADRPRGPVHRRFRIQDVLKEGQKVLVQVVKEERGSKGAALTTYFSLPGRYTVLMPNTPNAGGISRKITDYEERRQLRDTYKALDVPATMGLIIRTAGMGQEIDAIKADYANLQNLWASISSQLEEHEDIRCIHEDGSIIVRALRDMANDDVEEIIIAGQRAYKTAKDFAKAFIPEALKKISLYKEEAPIFSHYKVEQKLLQLHHERVQLPSGGSIVINPTEALVAIDINSGRNTSERNIEETAFKTNMEACEEIARQIRLRDLAGLIVVDFIDMENYGNTRKVEQSMRRALKRDRARIQTASISEFGLMEISRQRLRPSFAENHTVNCPHCGGTGLIISPSSAGLMLLRRLEEEDATGSDRITAAACTSTVIWLLNHKRDLIRTLEEKYKFQLLFKADDTILSPDAKLELTRLKSDGTELTSQVNVELREQPEVPPEKRYTKEGRAQRQKEDEAREDMKKPNRDEKPAPRNGREGEPALRSFSEAERKQETKPQTFAPVQESKPAPTPKQSEPSKPAREAKPTKPSQPKIKAVVEAADTPLAVQKVAADTTPEITIAPSKPKAKFALKQQEDTDRDLTPTIAVAKVSADTKAETAAPKTPRPKKAGGGLLKNLLGL